MPEQKKTIWTIHGAGMTAEVWGPIASGLKFPCHTFSLPGHGTAEKQLIPSIMEMSAWVNKQLSSHPPQSVILLAHSMGVLIALESANHPAVSSLILLGAAAGMPVHPDLLKTAAENGGAAADMVLKWGVSNAHPHAADIRKSLKMQMQAAEQDALRNDLAACNAYKQGATAAGIINRPTLILAGQDDKMTKAADGKILAGMVKNAQFQVLPDCGHMIMVEQPAATIEKINAFLSCS